MNLFIKFAVSLFFIVSSVLFSENDFFVLGFILVVSSVFVLLIASEYGNVFHVSWLISFVVFSFVPFVVFFMFFDIYDYRIISISIVASFLFLFFTKGILVARQLNKIPYHGVLIFAFPLVGLLLLIVFPEGSLGYILFSAAYLIFIQSSTFLSPGNHFIRVMLPFLLYFIVFYSFFWGGFGRLILAANLLIPLIVFMYSYRIKVNMLYIYMASAFVSVAMNLLRFGDTGDLLGNFINDSSVGPYVQSIDFLDKSSFNGIDFSGYFDQFLLMLFSFFPRSLWESKPIGFGRYYVEESLNASDFSEGHSIAALFIGEQIYYLGDLWLFGVVFSVAALAVYIRLLSKLNTKYFNISVAASLYITTFYWGGFASFGSRFSVSMLLVFILFVMLYINRKVSNAT